LPSEGLTGAVCCELDDVPNFEASLLKGERSLDREVKEEVMVLSRDFTPACKVSSFCLRSAIPADLDNLFGSSSEIDFRNERIASLFPSVTVELLVHSGGSFSRSAASQKIKGIESSISSLSSASTICKNCVKQRSLV
jgi:hypothetical protein